MKYARMLTRCWILVFLTAGAGARADTPALPANQQIPMSRVLDMVQAGAAGRYPELLETYSVGKYVYVRSLAVDRENNSIWVGTSTGVLEIDLQKLEPKQTFTREHGLANEYVFAIGLDRQGYKWFGTNAGGVSRYRKGQWKTFFPLHGLADYWVYSFAEQRRGDFWIGTWAGASRVNLKTLQFTNYVEELINEWVYAIDVDSQDRVWFGTEGGVSSFDGKSWRHWTHKDGMGGENRNNLPISPNTGLGTRSRHDLNTRVGGRETYNPNYVFALHVAPDDSVWVGTWGGGVARLQDGKWANLTEADGLAGNIVYSIAQSADGVLWFGTNHGLSRYDGKTWFNFGRREGLLEDNVYAIAIAPNGDVWAGTRDGVARLGYK